MRRFIATFSVCNNRRTYQMSQPRGHRKNRHRQLQASHQKNWLTGRYAVLETLRSGRWPVDQLSLADDMSQSEWLEIQQLAESAEVPFQQLSRDRLSELCGSRHHQGFLARMAEYPFLSVENLVKLAVDQAGVEAPVATPLIVICDRIQDTFNFGAILRCCDAVQVAGVVIGESEQAGVTPQVARSSAGAVNHVPIAVAANLVEAVQAVRSGGFSIAAASEKSKATAWDCDLSQQIALIVGSEAHGVCDELLELCTQHVRIPMLGQVSSLNVAVATGILLYEIRRQQPSFF